MKSVNLVISDENSRPSDSEPDPVSGFGEFSVSENDQEKEKPVDLGSFSSVHPVVNIR